VRLSRQQPTAVLAACALLASGFLPAEHVHVARDHDGHHSDVVHRHFEPHHQPGPQAAIDDEEDDHDVQWLITSFTSPETARQAAPASQLIEHDVSISPPEVTSHARVQPLFVSVHDPPWATASGLRAPPFSRL